MWSYHHPNLCLEIRVLPSVSHLCCVATEYGFHITVVLHTDDQQLMAVKTLQYFDLSNASLMTKQSRIELNRMAYRQGRLLVN